MRVGVDFDNTLVCYDRAFHRAALELGLIPAELAVSKSQVCDFLRRAGREAEWTRMQGEVYGRRMHEADAFAGALDCVAALTASGIPTFVISHKTRTPYAGPPHDLHRAASAWIQAQPALERLEVFFELSKEAKLRRIATCACTHFIDDLPDILGDPLFPPNCEPLLFDSHGSHVGETRFRLLRSWAEVRSFLSREPGLLDRPPLVSHD